MGSDAQIFDTPCVSPVAELVPALSRSHQLPMPMDTLVMAWRARASEPRCGRIALKARSASLMRRSWFYPLCLLQDEDWQRRGCERIESPLNRISCTTTLRKMVPEEDSNKKSNILKNMCFPMRRYQKDHKTARSLAKWYLCIFDFGGRNVLISRVGDYSVGSSSRMPQPA